MRLLIAEDDAKLVRALTRGLEAEGYDVDVALDGRVALERALGAEYDAILLDVMLPGHDGFAVCEQLRAAGDRRTPILMLTARSDVGDRIRGLDSGADDYLGKPFDFGELVARLRALTRRAVPDPAEPEQVAGLELDASTLVAWRDGRQVELTAREFQVLSFLAQNAGRVVSRSELIEAVWSDAVDVSPNVVDVYVGYLRRKLERPVDRRLIRTVRGMGFLLESG